MFGNGWLTTLRKSSGRSGGLLLLATALGSPAQTLTTVLSFDGKNGAYPHGSLVQATNGDLYGTTSGIGKPSHPGTVFKITLGGALKTLHRFCSQPHCADGREPESAPV